jgi:hypothetical protein
MCDSSAKSADFRDPEGDPYRKPLSDGLHSKSSRWVSMTMKRKVRKSSLREKTLRSSSYSTGG